ncbi:MAG: type II secretion system protein [Patescibacteria group bacterium]
MDKKIFFKKIFKKIFKNKKGFGLIELLIVIAIISLLSTIATVVYSGAKEKARDAKRIADAKQIQTALNIYFNDKELFPITTTTIILGTGNYFCLNGNGFGVSCDTEPIYVKLIPSAPTPPQNNQYTYASVDSGNDYQLSFVLEKINQDLGIGKNCAATKDTITCIE